MAENTNFPAQLLISVLLYCILVGNKLTFKLYPGKLFGKQTAGKCRCEKAPDNFLFSLEQ